MRSALTDEEGYALLPRYLAGESGAKLCQEIGVWWSAWYPWAHAHGVQVRGRGTHVRARYPVREDAFSVATPEAAYWIGFLMADGCVLDTGVIALGLAECDLSHVEKFRAFLDCSNPITTRTNAKGFKPGARLSSFRVQTPRLAADLARYGVTPRKSMRERVVDLEDDADFWRGVIDGDGCLSFHPEHPGTVQVILCGGEGIVTQFKEFVDRRFPGGYRQVEPRRGIFYHSVGGARAAKLVRLLYDRPGPSLDRKRVIAMAIMARRDRRIQDKGAETCKWGHARTATNGWFSAKGHRSCKDCWPRLRQEAQDRKAQAAVVTP